MCHVLFLICVRHLMACRLRLWIIVRRDVLGYHCRHLLCRIHSVRWPLHRTVVRSVRDVGGFLFDVPCLAFSAAFLCVVCRAPWRGARRTKNARSRPRRPLAARHCELLIMYLCFPGVAEPRRSHHCTGPTDKVAPARAFYTYRALSDWTSHASHGNDSQCTRDTHAVFSAHITPHRISDSTTLHDTYEE